MRKDDLRDKAIQGLERCDGTAVHLGHCPEDCPYFAESERADQCVAKLHADALALLKEQQSAYERGKSDGVSQYLREREEDEEYEY